MNVVIDPLAQRKSSIRFVEDALDIGSVFQSFFENTSFSEPSNHKHEEDRACPPAGLQTEGNRTICALISICLKHNCRDQDAFQERVVNPIPFEPIDEQPFDNRFLRVPSPN